MARAPAFPYKEVAPPVTNRRDKEETEGTIQRIIY